MRAYRLSQQAEHALEDVIGWTIDHFGIAQAIKYKGQLKDILICRSLDPI